MRWIDVAVSCGIMRRIVGSLLLAAHSCKYRMIGVMVSVISWGIVAG